MGWYDILRYRGTSGKNMIKSFGMASWVYPLQCRKYNEAVIQHFTSPLTVFYKYISPVVTHGARKSAGKKNYSSSSSQNRWCSMYFSVLFL